MTERILIEKRIQAFYAYLIAEEKSAATVEKYMRDVYAFADFVDGTAIEKGKVSAYKKHLQEIDYAPRSINSMLASLNSLFSYLGWTDCKVKPIKIQRKIYCPEEKELTKTEYTRLVNTARRKGNERLNLISRPLILEKRFW